MRQKRAVDGIVSSSLFLYNLGRKKVLEMNDFKLILDDDLFVIEDDEDVA